LTEDLIMLDLSLISQKLEKKCLLLSPDALVLNHRLHRILTCFTSSGDTPSPHLFLLVFLFSFGSGPSFSP